MHSFAAAAPSRFATIGRWPARVILLFLMILCVQGLGNAPEPGVQAVGASVPKGEEHADVLLYRRIIEQVRAGGDYYQVAAQEHRARDYPLRPFVTVRLPTLAYLHAELPPFGPTILFYMLVAATLGAWAWQLSAGGLPVERAVLGAMLLLAGAGTLLVPELIVWHECWAALLLALSLALRWDRRYGAAVITALAAATIREHAVLYALVMLGFALRERRPGECVAWSSAIAVIGALIAWHAGQVAAVTSMADAASPGWNRTGGWEAAVSMIQLAGPLHLVPGWVSAIAVPLALVGWAGWHSATAARGTTFLFAYVILLGTAARADNFYWAFLIAPLLPIGLLFAPRAIADLIRAGVSTAAGQRGAASLST